jgi:hypothetical protein
LSRKSTPPLMAAKVILQATESVSRGNKDAQG